MTTVAFTGSFNPITTAHINIIKKALRIFEKVIVCVANNPEKDYMWNLEQRLELCKKALVGYKRITIITLPPKACAAAYLKQNYNISYLIRGVHPTEESHYEESKLEKYNQKWVPTMYIIPDDKYRLVSSFNIRHFINYSVTPPSALELKLAEIPTHIQNDMVYLKIKNFMQNVFDTDISKSELLQRVYSNPNKKYHNWVHILRMTSHVAFSDFVLSLSRDKDNYTADYLYTIHLATLYHDSISDYIYNKAIVKDLERIKSDNFEYDSTAIAAAIMATNHIVPYSPFKSPLEVVLHDADLMILASDKTLYKEYSHNVQIETLAIYTFLTLDDWKRKRVEFLTKFQNTHKIFWDDPNKQLSNKAIENITAEIEQLTKK